METVSGSGSAMDQGGAPGTGATGGGGMSGSPMGGGQTSGGMPAGTGGADQPSWAMPEKWRGKSSEDIARAYSELERKLGEHGNELGRYREYSQRASDFISKWDPILRQVGYDPQRMASVLERAAQAASARGDHQQAQQLHAQAQQQQERAWSDMVDPRDQEQWLRQYVGTQTQGLEQRLTQQILRDVVPQILQYVNNYGDLALRAIDKKFGNPQLDMSKLLQEAVNLASNRYDPLEFAAKQLTAESPQQIEARIRADERTRAEQEFKNRQLTTGVGVGATPVSRPLKAPRVSAAPTSGAATRANEAASLTAAKERFLQKFKPEA